MAQTPCPWRIWQQWWCWSHLVLLMQVCFIFQSSRIMLPTRRPVNATTDSAPSTPSALTMPLAIAATASPGSTEMGGTVCQQVRVPAWLGLGAAPCIFLLLAGFRLLLWALIVDLASPLLDSKCEQLAGAQYVFEEWIRLGWFLHLRINQNCFLLFACSFELKRMGEREDGRKEIKAGVFPT